MSYTDQYKTTFFLIGLLGAHTPAVCATPLKRGFSNILDLMGDQPVSPYSGQEIKKDLSPLYLAIQPY
jgi:hypothetical protein